MHRFFYLPLLVPYFVFSTEPTQWKVGDGEWNVSDNWTKGLPSSTINAVIPIPANSTRQVSIDNTKKASAKNLELHFNNSPRTQAIILNGPKTTLELESLSFAIDFNDFGGQTTKCSLNTSIKSNSALTISGNGNCNPIITKNLTTQGDFSNTKQTLTVKGKTIINGNFSLNSASFFSGTSTSIGGSLTIGDVSQFEYTDTTNITGQIAIEGDGTLFCPDNCTIPNAIASSGSINVQNRRSVTCNGSISGYSLSIEGGGNLTATKANTIQTIRINDGTLEISRHGSLQNVSLVIGHGTTLVNKGEISLRRDMTNNGTLEGPGITEGFQGIINKQGHKIIGTSGSHFTGNLKVEEGDVIFEPGSSLDIISNGSFISDMSIDVVRFEEGAHLNLLMEPPSSPEEWLHFLEHGDSGTFLQVNSIHGNLPAPTVNYPGFAATMTRSGNDFSLDIEPLPLASLVSNHNQQKVAEVFDEDHENESMDFIYANSELYFLQLPELQAALDTLHPALFNNIALAQEETTSYITKVLSQRLEEITWSSPDKKDQSWEIWGQGLRDYAHQKGKHTLAGYTATTPGVIVGADVKIDNQFALGFHGAYTNSHISWERKQGHGHTTTGYGGLYGSWYTKNFLLGLSFLGGWNSSKASRSMHFGEIDRNAHHRVHGWEIAPQLELGGLWELDYISFEPFLKENYVYLHQNHYRESGAESLDLSVHSKNSDLLRSELGLGLFHCFQGKQLQFTPELKLSYIYESRFQGKNTTAYFLNNTVHPFTVKGLSPSRSLGHIGAFLKGSSYNGFDLTLDYNFLFGKEYRDHKMAVRLDYAF